jgi:hypothetical protein
MAVENRCAVGVLPDEGNGDERQSAAELDLALFTGMGKARNLISVLRSRPCAQCGLAADPSRGAAAVA